MSLLQSSRSIVDRQVCLDAKYKPMCAKYHPAALKSLGIIHRTPTPSPEPEPEPKDPDAIDEAELRAELVRLRVRTDALYDIFCLTYRADRERASSPRQA